MLEFIKDVIVDFVLFSAIEGFVFCLFFVKIGGSKKIKFLQWLLLSFVNCLISKILPPVIYQLVMVLWISMFLYFLNDKKKYFKWLLVSLGSMGMFFLLETVYEIILNKMTSFEAFRLFLTNAELIDLFILIIPLRIIEIINIFIMEVVKMKVVIGGVVRK